MNKIVPFKMTDNEFQKRVKRIAADASNIKFSGHARERMRERHILRKHVDTCLQKGRLVEPAHLDIHGNWKATMAHRVAGLAIKVAVVIDEKEQAIIVTVMKGD